MTYFDIIQPQSALSPYIRHYWHSNVDESQMTVDKIIPMGCIYMLFHRGGNRLYDYRKGRLRPDVFICGQSLSYSDVGPTGLTELLTVVFQPYAARIFFDMPASEFREQRVDVNDISDRKLIELAMRVKDAPTVTGSIALIEEFMLQRLASFDCYNMKRIILTVGDIANNPWHDLNRLAGMACYSSKQFYRVFMNIVGTSPKDLSRIARLQKALYLLRNSNLTLAETAYESGYADQSHMNREFKFFTNCTPMQYVSFYNLEKEPYSQYYYASMH